MSMKINPDFVLRKIAGDIVIVPTGNAGQYFNGLITLNEVAALIWEQIIESKSREEIVEKVLEIYNVTEDVARKDVNGFLDMLKERNILFEN